MSYITWGVELPAERDRLDADVDQLPRCQSLESSEQDGYQGAERFDSVRRRDEDNNGNWEGTDVLLMLQILIRRQQGVEVARRQLQEFAASPARPAHRCDGADFVLGQQPSKRPGKDSSSRMRTSSQEVSGEFESSDCLFTFHGGKIVEELIQRVPGR